MSISHGTLTPYPENSTTQECSSNLPRFEKCLTFEKQQSRPKSFATLQIHSRYDVVSAMAIPQHVR